MTTMCSGIVLSYRDLPEAIIERYRLRDRVIVRHEGAEREIRFMFGDRTPLIPAWCGRELRIVSWGNQDRRSKLPRTGWCRQESLEEGRWAHLEPERVAIPAHFGHEKGVWFKVRQGLRGILVRDERGRPHVYVLTTPASHYYQVMTRHDRMPVLIEETI